MWYSVEYLSCFQLFAARFAVSSLGLIADGDGQRLGKGAEVRKSMRHPPMGSLVGLYSRTGEWNGSPLFIKDGAGDKSHALWYNGEESAMTFAGFNVPSKSWLISTSGNMIDVRAVAEGHKGSPPEHGWGPCGEDGRWFAMLSPQDEALPGKAIPKPPATPPPKATKVVVGKDGIAGNVVAPKIVAPPKAKDGQVALKPKVVVPPKSKDGRGAAISKVAEPKVVPPKAKDGQGAAISKVAEPQVVPPKAKGGQGEAISKVAEPPLVPPPAHLMRKRVAPEAAADTAKRARMQSPLRQAMTELVRDVTTCPPPAIRNRIASTP